MYDSSIYVDSSVLSREREQGSFRVAVRKGFPEHLHPGCCLPRGRVDLLIASLGVDG